jgi:hypothetical protein
MPTISDDDIDRALSFLRDTADRAAVARAQRIYLEQWCKSVRAQIMLTAPGSSASDREAFALASPDYAAALEGYRAAVEADERFRFLREAASARIEAWRTQCSNERASRI